MAKTRPQLSRDPAFERFLGAAVGDDGQGSSVSVLSMLARLGMDPWDEAAVLATMKEPPAIKRLEALMIRFNDVTLADPDRSRIARKLLDFLPRRAAPIKPASPSNQAEFSALPLGSPVFWAVSAIIILGWVIMLARSG